jgi:hypothetical protein
MKRAAILLVALSALLAGCGGTGGQNTILGDTPGQADPVETATDAPQTPVETATPPDGPQGIEGDSVDTQLLAAGHAAALQQYDYRLSINRSGRINDSFVQRTSAGKLPLYTYIEKPSATARQYYTRTSEVGMDRRGVMNYANTTASGGGYVVQLIPGALGPTPADRRVNRYVRPLDLQPAGERTVDGRTYRVLTADMSREDIAATNTTSVRPSDFSEATGLEATLLVDQRGFVQSMNVTYEYENETTALSMRVDRIGSTTVEEPGWLCEARAQTRFADDC